jgi:pSer/pThr/pTyr-binding forkhead associated (FHA) protein
MNEAATPESSAAIPPGASVRVVRGFYEGLELPIDRNWMVIGRGRSADIVIADPTISRAHAAIGCDGEGFFVQDMGSTNGTRVNGERAVRTRLADRDEVLLGKLLLQVSLPTGSQQQSTVRSW